MSEPKINVAEVEHVARLARLELGTAEAEQMRRQLDTILGYVEQLQQVDTTDVAPTSHVVPLVNVMREDEVRPSYPAEPMLENAPERDAELFRVPKILEE